MDNYDYIGASSIAVALGAETSNIDVALDAAGSISGMITHESDGMPIQGSSLVVWATNRLGGEFGSIDSSGNYTIHDIPPGYYYVQVTNASGYQGRYYGNANDRRTGSVVKVAAAKVRQNINISLTQAGILSGTVVRDSNSTGINGSRGRAYNGGWNLKGSVTVANGTGAYSLTLPPGDCYIATYNVPGFVDSYYDNSTTPEGAIPVTVTRGATTAGINFRMADQGGSISGSVTRNSDGTGIYGASIQVYDASWNPVKTGSTNCAGNFTIAGLVPGTHYVSTNHIQGYIDRYFNNAASSGSATSVAVTQGLDASGVKFVLLPGGSFYQHLRR